jgi:hypothetical protein
MRSRPAGKARWDEMPFHFEPRRVNVVLRDAVLVYKVRLEFVAPLLKRFILSQNFVIEKNSVNFTVTKSHKFTVGPYLHNFWNTVLI